MDNLQQISKNRGRTQKIYANRTYSDDIHMEFRLDKSAKSVLKKGKLVHSQNLMLDIKRAGKNL